MQQPSNHKSDHPIWLSEIEEEERAMAMMSIYDEEARVMNWPNDEEAARAMARIENYEKALMEEPTASDNASSNSTSPHELFQQEIEDWISIAEEERRPLYEREGPEMPSVSSGSTEAAPPPLESRYLSLFDINRPRTSSPITPLLSALRNQSREELLSGDVFRPTWNMEVVAPKPVEYILYPKTVINLHYTTVVFYVEQKYPSGGRISPEASKFDMNLLYPAGHPCPIITIVDAEINSRYVCSFNASEIGTYKGYVKLGHSVGHNLVSTHIDGSPFRIRVTRNYISAPPQKLVGIGSGPGLDSGTRVPNCTWGLDIDRLSQKLYIADKVSHVVKVYTSEGKELTPIGKSAVPGETLFRPTGIAVDRTYNRLLITDKDNHRICLWGLDGRFIRSFGCRGFKNGEFRYPWDVAISPNGSRIAVTDSMNHRVQLFDREGNFISKYGVYEFNPFVYKDYLDLPRGICFDNDGVVIYVTDFNRNSLIAFNEDLSRQRDLVPPGRMGKPQGIEVDAAGNILICDSRHKCVRVVSPEGSLVYNVFGMSQPLLFPMDISFFNDGSAIVLDGNGTLKIF